VALEGVVGRVLEDADAVFVGEGLGTLVVGTVKVSGIGRAVVA
jgi:hypothetical protein